MRQQLELGLLGPLEARLGGVPVALGGRRPRAVLALLLLEANRVVSTDRLIDGVWGERPPAAAEATLQGYVSRLRKALGADLVRTVAPGYELRVDPERIDAGRFERLVAEGRTTLERGDAAPAAGLLRDALALWRGPPLADLADEPFAAVEAGRLEDLRLVCLEERIEADLALGRHAELVGELEALTGEQPLRERLRAQLMVALYRTGRQADALEAYRDARRTLVDELGLDPGRTLQELERAILAHEPALDPPRRVPADAAQAQPQPERPLIGRAAELTELERALAGALGGRGGLALVAGEPGIGKTRLADELLRAAEAQGATALWGRVWEAGSAPAYWPWLQVLRPLLDELDPAVLRAELGRVAGDLGTILPELHELLGTPPAPDGGDPDAARFRLFEAVAALLALAARQRPLVVCLDDLHAADEPSLLLLGFLAPGLAASRLLLLGTYRDTDLDPGSPVGQRVAELGRLAEPRLVLGGLAVAEVGEFIRESSGLEPSRSLIETIHTDTEGNPLFVGELVRLLAAQGRLDRLDDGRSRRLRLPASVREVIGLRLRRLTDRCRDTLSLGAVVGRSFELRTLEAAGAIDGDELLDLLDEALAARILVEDPDVIGRLRFPHMLIRDCLYDDLPAARRMRLHRKVGEALERLHGPHSEPHLAQLAHHFFEAAPAGEARRAVEYAGAAAEVAARQLAYEEAVRLYEMALAAAELAGEPDEESRCDLQLALAEAQMRAGDAPAAREAALQAAGRARAAGLADRLARAALIYGGRFVWARRLNDPHLVPLLEESLAAIGEEDSVLRVRLLARTSGALRDEFDPAPRDALSREAVEIARRLGDTAALALALGARWSAAWSIDNVEERLEIANEQIELCDRLQDPERAFEAHHSRMCALFELGRNDEAVRERTLNQQIAEELRQPAHLSMAGSDAALEALIDGRFADAEAMIAEAAALGERADPRSARLTFLVQIYLLRREQGRLAEVAEPVADAEAAFPGRPLAAAIAASLAARLGRRGDAGRIVEALAPDGFTAMPRDNEWLLSLTLLADACVAIGDAQRSAALYELLSPFAGRIAIAPPEGATGSVDRCLGVLAVSLSRLDDAAEHFERALRLEESFHARPWVAHTQFAYAQALLARGGRGDRDAAQALVASALSTAQELGIAALVSDLESLRTRD